MCPIGVPGAHGGQRVLDTRSGAGMAVHCHVGAGKRTWSSVRGVSTLND